MGILERIAMDNEEKVYLSHVIDFKRDIEPYTVTEIIAGVGTGKNQFIKELIEGKIANCPENLKVLLVTSRKAKVKESLELIDDDELPIFCEWIGIKNNVKIPAEYFKEQEDIRILNGHVTIEDAERLDKKYKIGKYASLRKKNTDPNSNAKVRVYQKSVALTNAAVQSYLQNYYNPDNPNTYIWNKFDVIAIDEVHSLVTDSTYQTAPFYVYDFIHYFLKLHRLADECPEEYSRPVCKNLILMTGTPDPVQWLFDEIKSKLNADKYNVLFDKNEFIGLYPKKVHFVNKEEAKTQIAQQISDGKRIIYFENFAVLPDDFCEGTNIDPAVVTISFTKDEKRNDMRDSEDEHIQKQYQDMLKTEDHIRKKNKVPEEFSLLLTTAKYKEGIDVKDDIETMYVESHDYCDVIQMAGRVRDAGLSDLYIVVDAIPFSMSKDKEDREQLLAENCLQDVNDSINDYIDNLEQEGRLDIWQDDAHFVTKDDVIQHYKLLFISMVESKFPYLRYSSLHEEFYAYKTKMYGKDYYLEQLAIWKEAYQQNKLQSLVKEWFPYSEVGEYDTATIIRQYYNNVDEATKWFEKYVKHYDYYTKGDYDKIRLVLQKLLNSESNQMKKLLSMIGRRYKQSGSKYYFYKKIDNKNRVWTKPAKLPAEAYENILNDVNR